jgi:hypothetical protein
MTDWRSKFCSREYSLSVLSMFSRGSAFHCETAVRAKSKKQTSHAVFSKKKLKDHKVYLGSRNFTLLKFV